MASSINASTSGAGGLISTADSSGVLNIQTAGTTAISVDASQNVTLTNVLPQASGGTGTTVGYNGFKNRIINGAMMIDQRNAGASVTLTASNFVYPVDRMFAFRSSGTSGAIAQRVASGITGGAYALRTQRNSGDTATAALGWGQVIESSNCQNMAGNSVTLSFKARIGANFSGASNQITARIGTGTGTDQSAANFYNIAWTGQSNTNTTTTLTTSWASYSMTISAGSSVNQLGVMFFYTPSGTASTNDWFEITDLQVEIGSTATSFDYRPYGTELALCQRYCYVSYPQSNYSPHMTGQCITSTATRLVFQPVVTMRTAPTLTYSGNLGIINAADATLAIVSLVILDPGITAMTLYAAVSSGLVAGNATRLINANDPTGKLTFSAEL